MFLQNRNRLTDIENKLLSIRGQKKWVGDNSGIWAMRYKPLCIK